MHKSDEDWWRFWCKKKRRQIRFTGISVIISLVDWDQTWTVFWKSSGTAAVNRFSAVFRGTETERWGMIAKRKKRVLQKTKTVHLRFLYFYHLCFLRGIRTGNSVLSHTPLKLDTAIGKPYGMRRDAQANQIKFKRRLQRQIQVQSCKSDRHGLHSFCRRTGFAKC